MVAFHEPLGSLARGYEAMDDMAHYAATAEHPAVASNRPARADDAIIQRCATVLGQALAEFRARRRGRS